MTEAMALTCAVSYAFSYKSQAIYMEGDAKFIIYALVFRQWK